MENHHADKHSFTDMQETLQAMRLDLSASETHGLVTGAVCVGTRGDGRTWMDPLLGTLTSSVHQHHQSRSVLLRLYHIISEQLGGLGASFQLLLPEHTQSIVERAQGLSDWCTGFLEGLRLGGLVDVTNCPTEASDALYHCMEIAQLDYDSVECSNDDATAFYQISEYVRLAAIFLHSEFGGGCSKSHARRLEQMRPFRPPEAVVH